MPRAKPDGQFEGIQFANVHPLIGNLSIRPEGGVDVAMYEALTQRMSLEEALDLSEIDRVERSWRDAQTANAELGSPRRG